MLYTIIAISSKARNIVSNSTSFLYPCHFALSTPPSLFFRFSIPVLYHRFFTQQTMLFLYDYGRPFLNSVQK